MTLCEAPIPTLSVAVTVIGTCSLAAGDESEVCVTMSEGTVSTGGVVSAARLTVKVIVAVPTFPAASDAVHVAVVLPTGYVYVCG